MSSVQSRCFAGLVLAFGCVLLAAQNAATQGNAQSAPCRNQEANQLLQRGHDRLPKSGYGLPPIVAAAGQALAYFGLRNLANRDR